MRCERVQVGRIRWTVRLRNQRWRRTPPNPSGLPANYILSYRAGSNALRYCSRGDGASATNTDFREGRVRPRALIPCSHRCDQSSDCACESGERCQYPRKSKPKRRLSCCRSLLWSSLSLLAYRPSLRRWFWLPRLADLFQSAPAELPQAQKGRDAQTSISLSICQILRATSAERFTNLRLKSN
jgi:hypothetical protein